MVSSISGISGSQPIDPSILAQLQKLGVSTSNITTEAQAESALSAAEQKAQNAQSSQSDDQKPKGSQGTPPWAALASELGINSKGKPEDVLNAISSAINALPDTDSKKAGYQQQLGQLEANMNANQNHLQAAAAQGMAQIAMQK